MPFGIILEQFNRMVQTPEEILKEKKDENRTFPEISSLGKIQDKITELENRIEELEAK